MAAFIGNQNAGPRFQAFAAATIAVTSIGIHKIAIAPAYSPGRRMRK